MNRYIPIVFDRLRPVLDGPTRRSNPSRPIFAQICVCLPASQPGAKVAKVVTIPYLN